MKPKCHKHPRTEATHMMKFAYCTFFTPVCKACVDETPWHIKYKVGRSKKEAK